MTITVQASITVHTGLVCLLPALLMIVFYLMLLTMNIKSINFFNLTSHHRLAPMLIVCWIIILHFIAFSSFHVLHNAKDKKYVLRLHHEQKNSLHSPERMLSCQPTLFERCYFLCRQLPNRALTCPVII